MGAAAFDLDDDGDQDLFVANDSGPNALLRNLGDGSFTDAGLLTGTALSADGATQGSMGAAVADADGNGLPDLVVTNFAHDHYAYYRGLAPDLFLEDAVGAGIAAPTFAPLGWGALFLDADNDGSLDIAFANGHLYPQVLEDPALGERYAQPDQLFRRTGEGYRETALGPPFRSSRGMAFLDVEGDGAAEIVVSNQDAPPTLWRIEPPPSASWLRFRLLDPVGERSGLGAEVSLSAGLRSAAASLGAGDSYASDSQRVLHFGLGQHPETPVAAAVRWADGTVETHPALLPRTTWLLRRGVPAIPPPRPMTRPRRIRRGRIGPGSGRRAGSPLVPLAAVALTLSAFVPSEAAPPEQDPEERRRMLRALALLETGEPERAIPLLLELTEAVPHHGPARLQLGALAIERGEWQVAAAHLRAAAGSVGEEAPEGAVPVQRPGLAWALLADALDEAGDLGEALEATERALRLAPAYLPALLRRSAVARRLAARDPEEPEMRTVLLETALRAARSARERAPGRPAPWTALALAAHDAHLPQLARCAAHRALELAPDDSRPRYLFARIVSEADPAAALEAAEGAVAAGLREEPAVWMTLGELRAFRMDLDGSLEAYRQALRLDPAAAGEMASLPLDAIAAGGDAELLDLLRDRAGRIPDALNTRFALAKAALRQGRTGSAVDELTRLAAAAPDHAAILTSLHAALRHTGDDGTADAVLLRLEAVQAAAAEAWERANAARQGSRKAREALAREDFAAAVSLWEGFLLDPALAAALAPGDLAADLAGLAGALASLERAAEAQRAIREALRIRPFHPEALARATVLAEDPEEAARYRERAQLAAADCAAFPEAPPGASGATADRELSGS